MCPLRDFAPPKLKVFRRACLRVFIKHTNHVYLVVTLKRSSLYNYAKTCFHCHPMLHICQPKINNLNSKREVVLKSRVNVLYISIESLRHARVDFYNFIYIIFIILSTFVKWWMIILLTEVVVIIDGHSCVALSIHNVHTVFKQYFKLDGNLIS